MVTLLRKDGWKSYLFVIFLSVLLHKTIESSKWMSEFYRFFFKYETYGNLLKRGFLGIYVDDINYLKALLELFRAESLSGCDLEYKL